MPDALNTDVLVIGGGLAGASAAQAAADAGANTLLVAKAPIGVGGASARASGGFAAAVGSDDSAALHAEDTIAGGCGVNTARQVAAITQRAPEALHRLNARAGGFTDRGSALQGQPAPLHSADRSVQYPLGMAHLMTSLRDGLQQANVGLLEDHRAVDLMYGQSGGVTGAHLFDSAMGRIVTCTAGAVVLAAGGCGQLFPVTSNGPDATGDAFALALRAGCAVRDMEFIQFTPTAFAAPGALRGHTIVGTLLTLEGVRLVNANGERFMERYAPERLEAADRATLARAIDREVREGRGTASGGVHLDATAVPADLFNRHRPGFAELCAAHGIDPCTDPLETAPAVHTCLGGVCADETLVAAPGLYVAGEALAGTHGANRLSSNSLTEALVTGQWAGARAAASARGRAPGAASHAIQPVGLPAHGAWQMAGLHTRLQHVMGDSAGVERSASGLKAGLRALAELQREHHEAVAGGADDVAHWIDLRNMLLTARAILGAALERTESRGAHFRTDFPNRSDEAWRGNIAVTLHGTELHYRYAPIS